MGDFGYDDGLVHGHRWASEPLGYSPRRAAAACHHEKAAYADIGYDEGLVHDHRWSSSTPAG